MVNKPPFDYDLRVSTDKKRKASARRGGHAPANGARGCDFQGCSGHGRFRAPKSPDLLDEFFWFCDEHIRAYNLKWNFFEGATDDEFQKFLDRDRVWERETKPFSRMGDGNCWARMGVNDPLEILGEQVGPQRAGQPATGATRRLPPTERRALEILDARDTMTRAEIRQQYRGLIKVLHPDMNGGDRSREEVLQEVVWAWDQIRESRHFRD